MNLSGMSCESCEKLIARAAEKVGVKTLEVDSKSGKAVFLLDEAVIPELKKSLAEKGFNERDDSIYDEQRGDLKNVFTFINGVISGMDGFKAEHQVSVYGLVSFAVITVVFALFFNIVSPQLNNAAAYIPLLFLAIVTSVTAFISFFHMRCYRNGLSCTNGMMVGMTTGMMTSFMAGALVGATNGMFIGSVFGTFIGILFGFSLGKYSGVMGAMEGIMAGLMAGTMGAMLSVMMLNDNLLIFLFLLAGLCVFTLGGLSYMMHREAGSAKHEALNANLGLFIFVSFAFTALLFAVMLYGPKGPVTYP